MGQQSRKKVFQKNEYLESYLKEINSLLWESEQSLLYREEKDFPFIFLMSAPRAGSTLMMQWAASTKAFAYPSNLVSRFYGAPAVGAMIERLLTDEKYRFRNELMELSQTEIQFESDNGKTEGISQPNEFWYFWRRFLPDDINSHTDGELWEEVDKDLFRKELQKMAAVYGKPLILKGMICNFHIGFLNRVFRKKIFVSIERNEERQIDSIIRARIRQYGTPKHWYSFQIPEYERIRRIEDPYMQIKEQLHSINSAIHDGIKDLPDENKIAVSYEEFCENPAGVYQKIYERLKAQGYEIPSVYKGIGAFTSR